MKHRENADEVDLFELSRCRTEAETISAHLAEQEDSQYPVKAVHNDPAPARSPAQAVPEHGQSDSGLNKFVKFILIAAVVCVIMMGVLVNRVLSAVNYVPVDTGWSDSRAKEAPDWPVREEQDIANVLLLGIDGDGGSSQRSDTIMLLTLDGQSGSIKMTSILRDTYVAIPGRKQRTRINHAYSYGGAALTMQTIESNFRVKVDRYASIDMKGLTALIDSLGGVELTLSKKEAVTVNAHVANSHLTEGTQHLNGAQATYFARIRKIDSDFGRTGRQRKLIKAMLAAFREQDILAQYAFVSQAAPYITTNLTQTEMAALAVKAAGMLDGEMQELSVPVKGAFQARTVSNMAVLVPNIPKNCEKMHEFIFGDIPAD